MSIPSRQIGWGTEENLLWQISKQLEQLTGVTSKISSGGGGEGSYLKYVALLNQSGTSDPVATVLENTLGSTPVWVRSSQDIYYADFILIDPTKVFVLMTGNYSGEGNGNVPIVSAEIYDDGSGYKVWFAPKYFGGGNIPGDWGAPIFIEIRVYP